MKRKVQRVLPFVWWEAGGLREASGFYRATTPWMISDVGQVEVSTAIVNVAVSVMLPIVAVSVAKQDYAHPGAASLVRQKGRGIRRLRRRWLGDESDWDDRPDEGLWQFT